MPGKTIPSQYQEPVGLEAKESQSMSEIENALKAVAGLEVITDENLLTGYQMDDSGLAGSRPLAVVRPSSVQHLQQLIAIARGMGIQFMPISSSLAHHRGDTLCEHENTLVLDMSGFDEVIRADRRNRVVMLEAGVTFAQLEYSARAVGLRPMLPVCPRPGKSALTAYLEREPTIYPRFMWDTADPLMCLEVIFGSGELFRTGSAAGPGSIEEQWATGNCQKTPMGPGHSDLQRLVQGAQGSLGVVTWCTAKAEPIPAGETLYVLRSGSLEDLVEISYRLLRRELPDICFIVDDFGMAAIRRDHAPQPRGMESPAAQWNLVFSLSAPLIYGEEKLAYVRDEVREICAHFLLEQQLHNFEPRHQDLLDVLTRPSHPANSKWWKLADKTATRELFFQTTLDCAAQFVPTAEMRTAAYGSERSQLMTYIQPQLGGRHCHMEFIFPHEKKDPANDAQMNKLVLDLAGQLAAQGAFFSRPYGPLAEITRSSPATAKMFANLRRIFDPHAVMAPAAVTRERVSG